MRAPLRQTSGCEVLRPQGRPSGRPPGLLRVCRSTSAAHMSTLQRASVAPQPHDVRRSPAVVWPAVGHPTAVGLAVVAHDGAGAARAPAATTRAVEASRGGSVDSRYAGGAGRGQRADLECVVEPVQRSSAGKVGLGSGCALWAISSSCPGESPWAARAGEARRGDRPSPKRRRALTPRSLRPESRAGRARPPADSLTPTVWPTTRWQRAGWCVRGL